MTAQWIAIPWTRHSATSVVEDVIHTTGNRVVAVRVVAECDQEDEALLIAAAPELLAALKALADNIQRQDAENDLAPPTEASYQQCMQDARAAIAKATGSAA